MSRIIRNLFATLVFLAQSANAVPILEGNKLTADFNDGVNSGVTNFTYPDFGMSFVAWRYHDSTLSGNLSFPFVDGWGLVIDGGLGLPFPQAGFLAAEILFASPIRGVSADFAIQLAPFDNIVHLIAYDAFGQELGRISSVDPPQVTTLALRSLALSNIGAISRLVVATNRKLGMDTLHIVGISAVGIPEPSTWTLVVAGLLVGWLGMRRKKLNRWSLLPSVWWHLRPKTFP